MNLDKWLKISIVLAVTYLSGCAGQQAFHHMARSNDTVAVAAGWMQTFSRDSMKVTITDYYGTQTVYDAGNANIRAVINMYPDPLSNIVVARESGIETSNYATTYADQVSFNYTGDDKDWWQTIVFVNLPDNMALGNADVMIESIDGVTGLPVEAANTSVEIVTGVGAPNPFSAHLPVGGSLPLSTDQLTALERSSHYQIDFTGGTTVPTAITVEMTHDPDLDNGGIGRAFVVNPTGEVKNIHWADDGVTAKAIIMPASSAGFSNLTEFKFYVSGGINNLAVSNVQAYDINGNEILSVSAAVTQR